MGRLKQLKRLKWWPTEPNNTLSGVLVSIRGFEYKLRDRGEIVYIDTGVRRIEYGERYFGSWLCEKCNWLNHIMIDNEYIIENPDEVLSWEDIRWGRTSAVVGGEYVFEYCGGCDVGDFVELGGYGLPA